MELINELGNELALTFLVEKRFAEKIASSEVPYLIDKIKDILQPSSTDDDGELQPAKMVKTVSH